MEQIGVGTGASFGSGFEAGSVAGSGAGSGASCGAEEGPEQVPEQATLTKTLTGHNANQHAMVMPAWCHTEVLSPRYEMVSCWCVMSLCKFFSRGYVDTPSQLSGCLAGTLTRARPPLYATLSCCGATQWVSMNACWAVATSQVHQQVLYLCTAGCFATREPDNAATSKNQCYGTLSKDAPKPI